MLKPNFAALNEKFTGLLPVSRPNRQSTIEDRNGSFMLRSVCSVLLFALLLGLSGCGKRSLDTPALPDSGTPRPAVLRWC